MERKSTVELQSHQLNFLFILVPNSNLILTISVTVIHPLHR